MDETFYYKPLDRTTGEIRLVRLHMPINAADDDDILCDLITTPLPQSPPYEALSYTWGSSENKRTIKLNGKPFQVTQNLYVALKHLRERTILLHNEPKTFPHTERMLWIDAICINQDDLDERNFQVRLMWHIYSVASQVTVWLGEEADDSDVAMEMIRLLDKNYEVRMNNILEELRADAQKEATKKEEADKSDGKSGLEETSQPEKSDDVPVASHDDVSQLPASTADEGSTLSPEVAKADRPTASLFMMTHRPVVTRANPKAIADRYGLKILEDGEGAAEATEATEVTEVTEVIEVTEADTVSHKIDDPSSPTDNLFKGMKEMDIRSDEENSYGPMAMILMLHGSTFGAHEDPQDPSEWIAVQKLLQRSWWRRVWVIQEIAASRKNPVLVGCGESWLRWDSFMSAALNIDEMKRHPFYERLNRLGEGTRWVMDKARFKITWDGRRDSWGGLMNLLFFTSSYHSTDPRDKVFALAGLVPSLNITPDYRAPVEEIYSSLVRNSIQATGSLMMLLLIRKPRKLDLPSWVPDLSTDLDPDLHNGSCPMGFYGADGNNWHNMGARSAYCSISSVDEPHQLSVTGFLYDKPLVLGPAWIAHKDRRQSSAIDIIQEYSTLLEHTDAKHFPNYTGWHREDAFWRTLIWNANDTDRYPVPDEFGDYFRRLKAGQDVIVDPSSSDTKPENAQKIAPTGVAKEYYNAFVRHGLNRRFFITSRGYLGSGPADMKDDDQVCILMGGKPPFILRDSQDHPGCYELIGHAYIHGIMHGEALGYLDAHAETDFRTGSRTLGFKNMILV